MPSPAGVGGAPAPRADSASPGEIPNSFFWLSAGSFWLFAVIGAFSPIVPLYFSDLGVTASGIAFLTALHAATAMIVSQLAGYIADVWMRRTTLLLVTSLLCAGVAAVFPWIPPTMPWLAAGMILLAFFFSHRLPIYTSLILDSTNGESHFGPIRLTGSLGFAVCAVAVGWLAGRDGFSNVVMWPAMVIFELLFVFTLIGLRDHPPAVRAAARANRVGFWQAQKRLLANRVFTRFLVFIFICQFVAFPGHMLQIKLMRDMGASSLVATLSLALAAISEMIIFLYARQITGRIRLMPLLALIPACLTLRWGIIFSTSSILAIVLSNILHMITFGLLFLCGVLLVNREIPRQLKSSGQTLYALVFNHLSVLLGNLAASGFLAVLTSGDLPLTDEKALRWMFGAAAVIPLLAYAPFLSMKAEYERKHQVSGILIRPGDKIPGPAPDE